MPDKPIEVNFFGIVYLIREHKGRTITKAQGRAYYVTLEDGCVIRFPSLKKAKAFIDNDDGGK
jgi:hypothetical protein